MNNSQKYTNSIDAIAECLSLGASEFVISTGARNAEIIYSILSTKNLDYYSHPDERSASFFALGRCISSNKPVVMLTTSGTAVAELYPACIEAYYQSRPLILLTADRPIEYQGSGAPQSINQINIFGEYAETTPSKWNKDKPLHINVHLEEPDLNSLELQKLTGICKSEEAPIITSEEISSNNIQLENFLDTDDSINIIVGTLSPELRTPVLNFIKRSNIPAYAESVSGLRERINSLYPSEISANRILRIGGIPSCRYWRDLENKTDIKVLSVTPNKLPGLSRRSKVITKVNWDCIQLKKTYKVKPHSDEASRMDKLLEKYPNSEPSFIRKISNLIPKDSLVFHGNSLPIRQWQIAATHTDKNLSFFANRGANGIDGNISTFLGLSKDYNSSWGIFGDLTTIYDLNSPWFLNYLENSQTNIVVINNGGGKIFEHVKSLEGTPEFIMNTIKNSHNVNFFHWSKMWNLNYILIENINDDIDSTSPKNIVEIRPNEDQTKDFWREFLNQ